MMTTCNFDKDDNENRKNDKLIVRIPPGQTAGADSPSQKPVKSAAYLWVPAPRHRPGKSWRDNSSIN